MGAAWFQDLKDAYAYTVLIAEYLSIALALAIDSCEAGWNLRLVADMVGSGVLDFEGDQTPGHLRDAFCDAAGSIAKWWHDHDSLREENKE